MAGDDRFGDLGPGKDRAERPAGRDPEPEAESGPSAADRFAELDERDLEQEGRKQRSEQPRPSGRYAWVVGVAFFLVIVVGMARLIANDPSPPGLEDGDVVPAFAAPLATGSLDGDTNIKQSADQSDQAGGRPACEVRGDDVLNICERRRKPLALAFMFTRAANCEPQLDRIDKVRGEFPNVNFAGVIIKEEKDSAAKIVRDNGWGFPVAFDRDGQLSTLYDVRGCPTTVFAYAGGRVRKTANGNLSEAELRAELRALEKGPPRPPSTATPPEKSSR